MTVEQFFKSRTPFSTEPEKEGYEAWRSPSTNGVRDLVFFAARGSGQSIRGESYVQVITWELSEDETSLFLRFETSGHKAHIKGRGLGEVARMISSKQAGSVHVWTDKDGPMPNVAITGFAFDKRVSDA